MKDKKIVVIGGGTGTSTVLSGLKKLEGIKLTAIVAVSDSGGNTGRLRDEFGFVPVGDIRQCLAALTDGDYSGAVRKMLLYRFGGKDLNGFNLGNLILTALEDIYKSPGKAVEVAGAVLRTKGDVFPISEEASDLVVTYADGFKIVGEDYLNYVENGGKKIKNVALTPKTEIYHKAAQAITNADVIVFGPGDLYASLLPNTLVSGFKETLRKAQGKFVYVVNLMNSFQQTHQMSTKDYVAEVVKYTGRTPDVIIVNNEKFKDEVLKEYAKHGDFPMIDDLPEMKETKIIHAPLISKIKVAKNMNDTLPRGVIRHDANKLAQIIKEIAFADDVK